ncbi:hypothetical protein ACFQE5_22340 [Pseudonocardia hispaniensis]|uniref:HK97 gp10 family phage protein n=1 Tax=Pseudonocardia hispaniensis TaxID=904933 RepID=A0ABW1J8T4_9PSEU
MAAALVWTKIHGQEQYRALARRLREAGRGDLQRKLTKAIRAEGDPALRAVRAAWMTVDVTSSRSGGSSSGLRARVAAATRISILGSGIRIRVEGKRVDPVYGRSLSYGLDGLGRWRHPVFGNREVWEQQRGQEVFYSTLRRYESRWRAGIEQAMADVARQIEG